MCGFCVGIASLVINNYEGNVKVCFIVVMKVFLLLPCIQISPGSRLLKIKQVIIKQVLDRVHATFYKTTFEQYKNNKH